MSDTTIAICLLSMTVIGMGISHIALLVRTNGLLKFRKIYGRVMTDVQAAYHRMEARVNMLDDFTEDLDQDDIHNVCVVQRTLEHVLLDLFNIEPDVLRQKIREAFDKAGDEIIEEDAAEEEAAEEEEGPEDTNDGRATPSSKVDGVSTDHLPKVRDLDLDACGGLIEDFDFEGTLLRHILVTEEKDGTRHGVVIHVKQGTRPDAKQLRLAYALAAVVGTENIQIVEH